jgi:uncharacterized membrane protein YdjX (TVP38/TMEM64 family)
MVRKLAGGLQERSLRCLLAVRSVPDLPSALVTVTAALVGVPLRTFMLATTLGSIPSALLYGAIGARLGGTFGRIHLTGLQSVPPLQLEAAVAGIAAICLIPIALRSRRNRRA